MGEHAVYIAWSYIGVALVSLGLIALTWLRLRRQQKRLADLEASGARRRSGTPAS